MRFFAVLAVLLVSALALSACVPVAKVVICSDGRQVSDASQCNTGGAMDNKDGGAMMDDKKPGDAMAEKEDDGAMMDKGDSMEDKEDSMKKDEDVVVANKDLSKDAQALFDKAAKTKNIQFNFFYSGDPTTQNKYYVNRDYVKITLVGKSYFDKDKPYDTVYLDLKAGKASAYCESDAEDLCADRNKKYDVNYEDFRLRTPYQWLDIISKAELTGRTKKIEGRTVKEATFQTQGKAGTIWLDSFFGLPLEVEMDGNKYQFLNSAINEATATDFTHQQLTNK